MVKIGVYI